ncbi:methyltransferase-like protein [Thermothelomyces thermophilus ATCC 42464]|uniref:Histone-lysine N-methyltransferase, H3 lysine-36 specific n=1 Tax=Thermothelomyces thermophilus (strain ATCC 42464 / BCRC 31852 / DSM 1799) TaxID=573729 RepID=G2QBP9_THET4|nr:methyltransferase-like protein [Thermothelomyces thermophilus ATCC 42464]AEO57992.1 methyltransferase-like protein [Thermothelomyces thermophilus ATCC 42464]
MEGSNRASGVVAGPETEERQKSNGLGTRMEEMGGSATPNGSRTDTRASSMSPDDAKPSADSISTPENGTAPKLSRKSSQKMARSPPPLFDHLPDATEEACSTFQVINDCLYGSRNMGSSDHDALDCDCAEDWHDGQNHACGEDSDCINRATKIECVSGDCNCGEGCQNQRFQRKQYAKVSVIKTEKKGFGLRADTDLQANDFVYEYVGEVINEPTFRSRMVKYDREGIKHFYFMSLTKNEFVDATKKGNLGRFCNHSCNPNCYVDKWVVGEKLRMGIFAGRAIRAGEELVFNYNVDRYGADPQPCYCGEPNCVGFIGGKTQTERATKLPLATIEALGIDDGDSWDTTVAKKPRKKKAHEGDEEYVNSLQPRALDEDGVTKVMAALMQCKEKWIAVKLLSRLQATEDDHLRHRVVRMHGYQILKSTLNTFKDDMNVVLQILDILYQLPRITKNKISDSKIEGAVQPLVSAPHEEVALAAKRLLDEWSKLETAYRIPRKKHDHAGPVVISSFEEERRNKDRDEPAKPVDPLANVVIPTGPRSSIPQRNANYFTGQRPRKPPTNLPAGWFVTTDKTGRYYFYDVNGKTQWQRPLTPAIEIPKASAKAQQDQKTLQNIIDSLTKEPTPRHSTGHTPQRSTTPATEPKKEKWRSLPIEKQMKIYENTLFPHVKHVVDKFHGKLPKEELKKFAREVNKKLVASDYKNNRVEDPTSVTPKVAKKVRKYTYDFFERAAVKYAEYEKKKKEARSTGQPVAGTSSHPGDADSSVATPAKDDTAASDAEGDAPSPGSSAGRKRKREDDDDGDQAESPEAPPSETQSVKRAKEDEAGADVETPTAIPSPPTPPPPPMETPLTEEERSMREQEEALMRENEEAQRLEDEAAQAAEYGKQQRGSANGEAGTGVLVNGVATAASPSTGTNGRGTEVGADVEMEIDEPPQQDAGNQQQQQRAVLSH